MFNPCNGPVKLSYYYAGNGVVPIGTTGYPGGILTPIPSAGRISFSNFHGAPGIPVPSPTPSPTPTPSFTPTPTPTRSPPITPTPTPTRSPPPTPSPPPPSASLPPSAAATISLSRDVLEEGGWLDIGNTPPLPAHLSTLTITFDSSVAIGTTFCANMTGVVFTDISDVGTIGTYKTTSFLDAFIDISTTSMTLKTFEAIVNVLYLHYLGRYPEDSAVVDFYVDHYKNYKDILSIDNDIKNSTERVSNFGRVRGIISTVPASRIYTNTLIAVPDFLKEGTENGQITLRMTDCTSPVVATKNFQILDYTTIFAVLAWPYVPAYFLDCSKSTGLIVTVAVVGSFHFTLAGDVISIHTYSPTQYYDNSTGTLVNIPSAWQNINSRITLPASQPVPSGPNSYELDFIISINLNGLAAGSNYYIGLEAQQSGQLISRLAGVQIETNGLCGSTPPPTPSPPPPSASPPPPRTGPPEGVSLAFNGLQYNTLTNICSATYHTWRLLFYPLNTGDPKAGKWEIYSWDSHILDHSNYSQATQVYSGNWHSGTQWTNGYQVRARGARVTFESPGWTYIPGATSPTNPFPDYGVTGGWAPLGGGTVVGGSAKIVCELSAPSLYTEIHGVEWTIDVQEISGSPDLLTATIDFRVTNDSTNNCGPPGTCFPAGSMVSLANGQQKAIQDVVIGEELVSGLGGTTRVYALHRPVLGTRKAYRINNRITTTGDHLFKTAEGWASIDPELYAKIRHMVPLMVHGQDGPVTLVSSAIDPGQLAKLAVGSMLLVDNNSCPVESIEELDLQQNTQLYSLITADTPSFVVEGFVVDGSPQTDDNTGDKTI